MLPLAALHAASLGGLVALGISGAPTGALVACGLAAGITIPPVGSVVRPLLGRPARPRREDLLPTAYALDGIAIELVFVTGPLLTAAIVVVASPAVALLVACGFVLLGTVVLVTIAGLARLAAGRARDHERHLLGALASPGVRTIVAATAPVGFALGATEVTMTAFATDHGSRAAAGALMAAWAAGSGVGGLAYGGREHTSAPGPRWVRLAALFPLCSLPLLLRALDPGHGAAGPDRRAVPGALHGRRQPARGRRRAPGRRHGGLRVADHRHRARRRRRQRGRGRHRAVAGAGGPGSGRWSSRGR